MQLRKVLQPRQIEQPNGAAEISPLKPSIPPIAKAPPPLPSPAAPRPPKPEPTPAKVMDLEAGSAKELVARGRMLLHLLEHGQGPAIELAWPDNANARSRLYRRFRDCLGMQVALRQGNGDLFTTEGPPGRAWRPNPDQYSSFARQPSGRLVAAEQDDLRTIARRHGMPPSAPAMRIFPRRVDARLLAGLDRLLAGGYAKSASIRGRYHLDGGRILILDIRIDDRAVPGRVDLGASCRRS